MAKFRGAVGFGIEKETGLGVWTVEIVEKTYSGDINRKQTRYQSTDGVNDNFNVNNEISIVADSFAVANLQNIRYVTWLGNKWKVNTIMYNRPRITLEIGGIYTNADSNRATPQA